MPIKNIGVLIITQYFHPEEFGINDLALESSEASVQANQAADTQLGESAAMLELIGKFKT